MNAVVVAIVVMCALSLSRVSVVLSLIIAAVVGGSIAGLDLIHTMKVFNGGVGGGAEIALSYAILGAFALALAKSGLPDLMAYKIVQKLQKDATTAQVGKVKYLILGSLLLAAVLSQNVIPVHIAFIPVLVPPLLMAMNRLNLDRRAVACVLTMGLVGTYMLIPAGFGAMFLEDIVMKNINIAGEQYGFAVERGMMPVGMAIPVVGMLVGVLFAVFVSYRKPRQYQHIDVTPKAQMRLDGSTADAAAAAPQVKTSVIFMAIVSIALTLVVHLYTSSMALGGLVGFAVLSASGIFKWKDADDVFLQGMRMMALIGFIMIAAAGFAAVMKETGHVDSLVQAVIDLVQGNQGVAAFLMLLVGLLVTLGIGSSFSTVPILTVLYVPLCIQLGFSPLATVAIIGTAAALGDAGSPASDSTLGPTSGLGIDGQHDHIWDTVVPTFLHFNLPLLAFGWIAAMVL
ncbi:MAG: Na+/H+ antiporter NhaC family protein [Acinetobacter sp.]|nr:Na+/H+ antiporter NhaC family protein [Acinetobacter sp.]